jgi:hypothetical protein
MKKKELYSLKDEVLKLSIKEGMAHVKGYHKQINERYKYQMESYYNRLDYDESFGYDDAFMPSEFFYLKLIEMNGYTFHVPIDEPEGLFLGEIPIISAEKQATNITVSQAKLILKTFLKQNDSNLITI